MFEMTPPCASDRKIMLFIGKNQGED